MQPVEPQFAHVLFADMVAYSLLSLEAQSDLSCRFRALAGEAAERFGCRLVIDSGDGAALVFFESVGPAIECAVSLSTTLAEKALNVRIGLHSGLVTRSVDINGSPSVIGPGINLAERVMSCGDAGHLLLSADTVGALAKDEPKWAASLVDFGEHEVKHGVKVRLASIVTDSCGRSDLPNRLRIKTRPAKKNNFTEPERKFVGRKEEVEALRERLDLGEERLITITGPGGIGKTRLAIEAARLSAPNFADGAWVVECQALATADDLIAQIASVLDVPLGRSPLGGLIDALSDKQLLLIADCLEQITPHVWVLEEILKHAREVQILATSRTLLGLLRENEVVLGPLSMSARSGGASDGVQLFVSAAKAVDPNFKLTRRNRQTVGMIIEAVEAVPLAIVLAAGRLRHLSLVELEEQLAHRRLDILKRRVPGEDRHSNLRRVVDDSFALLRPELRELLVSLSVFSGFTAPDAETVLPGNKALLDEISELRENSLLSAQVVADKMRFRCLDVVAEYLQEVADSNLLEPIRARHANHYAKRSATLREWYEDGQWTAVSSTMALELGNFRRAIEFSISREDKQLIRVLANSLCRILMEGGYRADFEALALAGERVANEDEDLTNLIEITGLIGGVYRRDHKYPEAERHWLKKARFCSLAGEVEKEADAWLDLADMAIVDDDIPKAEGYLNKFSEIEPRLPLGVVLTSGYVRRARVAARGKQGTEAKAYAERALELAAQLPNRSRSFFIWSGLAEVFNEINEPEITEKICLTGLREAVLGRHYAYAGQLLHRLCVSLELQGRSAEAALGVAIAKNIPKSISQTVRQQVMGFKEDLIKKHGPQLIRSCEIQQNGLNWQTEAETFVEALMYASKNTSQKRLPGDKE